MQAKVSFLEAAQLGKACLFLVTVPAMVVAQSIVLQAQQLNPSLDIMARAEGVELMKALYERGANQVVQPEFEAGLEMTRQALLHLHVPATEILRYTDTTRRDLYTSFHGNHDGYQRFALLQSAGSLLELNWLTLDQESASPATPSGSWAYAPVPALRWRVVRKAYSTLIQALISSLPKGDWRQS